MKILPWDSVLLCAEDAEAVWRLEVVNTAASVNEGVNDTQLHNKKLKAPQRMFP